MLVLVGVLDLLVYAAGGIVREPDVGKTIVSVQR